MLQPCFIFLNVFTFVLSKYGKNENSENAITTKTYAIWKNGVVPFYVNPAHFDHEQTLSILSALSLFAFKTCIKFKPVMARPDLSDEVMMFINPEGTKRCQIPTKGHSVFNPHFVKLGYECLKSPQIDMMIMRALGFPFEHNRETRDLYIDVLNENIEPGYLELFTKEDVLPLELRFLPYDVNSVMHFGNRDYSKNGHRAIIFKDHSVKQNRVGLTDTDIKKIEIVYGPECRARDRQEKVELCQSYPGVARRKRQLLQKDLANKDLQATPKTDIYIEKIAIKSLRVNPDITPPPVNQTEDIMKDLKELGIDEAVEEIVEQVYKVSSLALKNARIKYCNDTNDKTEDPIVARQGDVKLKNSSDILGIIEVVADFAKGMVEDAIQNLTKFCENSKALEVYQRYSCVGGGPDNRCRQTYRSTKSGAVRYSTQHRPVMTFSTGVHRGYKPKVLYHNDFKRSGNATEDNEPTTQSVRRKRSAETTTTKPEYKVAEVLNSDKKVEEPRMKAADKEVTGNKEVNKEKVSDKDKVEEIVKSDVNKETTVKGDKEKVTEVETDDIKAKSGENIKIDNKEHLRLGTRVPYNNPGNRRSYGHDRHRLKSDLDDVMIAKKIIENKHIVQKNRKVKHKSGNDDTYRIRDDKINQEERNRLVIPDEAYVKTSDSEIGGERFKFDSMERVLVNRNKKKRKENIKETPIVDPEQKEDSVDDAEENVKEETNSEERPKRHRAKKKQSPQMASPDLPRTVALSKKNEEFYNERRWPDGELVYMIQADTTYDLSDMKLRLREVRDILKQKTCVTMTEIKPGEANKYEDYIVIDNSPDYVTGRVGGKQNFGSIELFRGGQHRQHAAMMVMAMLGFYFEVSRHDRDKFIRVHMRHVRPDKLHHFEMIRSDATLRLPYDYASATHPAWQFWRQMGRTGISTVATYKEKDPDGSIMNSLGQNEKLLSDLDIVKINSVYGVDCFQTPRAKTGNYEQKNSGLPTLAAEE